jgi:LuxR family maltose regulon positive regulatory protein
MEYQVSAPCAWSDINRYTTLARGYLASKEGCFEDAISILEPLQRDAESVHNYSFALRVAMHLSLVSFRTRRDTEALRSFGRILASSAEAGIYSTILDEREDVGSLLLAFQENTECGGTFDELMPFVGSLIAGWRSRYRAERHETAATKIAGLLSTRQRDTLALIAQGLSNKEIARSLAVTPETVKSHVKLIFAKLNVEKRAQAVARAQSLGLVGTR